MKLLAWMLTLILTTSAYAELVRKGSPHALLLKKAGEYFSQGKYASTAAELKEVLVKLKATPHVSKDTLGLVVYWKGIAHARNQDYPEAIASFDEALKLGYIPEDLHYEYGQALFASEKLEEARLQFRESIKRKFKRAVSLYYIGYISKELGERKKAFTFLRAIEKLKDEEAMEVRQPAEMLIGDIYLEQAERHPDTFRAVESYVIPQYKKALAIRPDSNIAPDIQRKIVDLQRRYDLVLFQLVNGRATLQPPYLLRLAAEYGYDSNVTFVPTDTNIFESEQSSTFAKTSAIGRYTFYYRDFFSVSPELSFTYTRYLNREPEIYRNDNYFIAPSLRTAYEHTLWKKPASFLLDYEYMEIKRDINAKKELEFNSRSHGISVGERFNYFLRGESVARLRYRKTDSYLDSSDSTTTSFTFEQVYGLTLYTILFYFSYDRMRMTDQVYDTDSMTFRGDLILPSWGSVSPSIGFSLTSTDPINDRDNRGRELLINPSARFSKSFGTHWRANLKYDYQENRSEDEENFAFKKSLYSLELEYVF